MDRKKRLVKKATKLKDPIHTLDCLPQPGSLCTNDGEQVYVETGWATQLPHSLTDWIFELFKTNMRTLYQKSNWGYDPSDKQKELMATTARFVILLNSKKQPIAYCHYRMDMDFEAAVLYCYEIQVEGAYQRKGVGSILMTILENLAKKLGMDKILATVFNYNELSLKFFRKNGFFEDETSPTPEMDVDYFILGKNMNSDQVVEP